MTSSPAPVAGSYAYAYGHTAPCRNFSITALGEAQRCLSPPLSSPPTLFHLLKTLGDPGLYKKGEGSQPSNFGIFHVTIQESDPPPQKKTPRLRIKN